jgi:myo-inositol-1(or 4)-monophosphatase
MIEQVITIAVEAGRIVETARSRGLESEEKGGGGPVTRADRESDGFLRHALGVLLPAAWLSEETRDDLTRLEAPRVWIVDPVDGTKEFIRGLPEYSVSIALVESGLPSLAVVHNPATAETFWAVRGEGAFGDGRPLRVRDGSTLLASRTEVEQDEFESFRDGWTLRPCGSIAYKMALVAAGRAAGTLSRGPKGEWDICAGSLLVEEAGGVVTDGAGEPCRFNRSPPKIDSVVAASPEAHARLLKEIRRLGLVTRTQAG